MKTFRLLHPELAPRCQPDEMPRAIGDVVRLVAGSPPGLLVDFDDGIATVARKHRDGRVSEYLLPLDCLCRVRPG